MTRDMNDDRHEPGREDAGASHRNPPATKTSLAANEIAGTDGDADATRDFDPDSAYPDVSDIVLSGIGVIAGESEPRSLGKYTIQSRIGRGGMGVVFKGTDPDLHRTVAIKVLSPHLAQSPVARRRFQREARAAAAISHPNVLTIHSVEEHQKTPFLVMEYVAGKSLKEYVLSKGKLDPMEVIRLSTQIAQGLAAAHAQGVIHRDVKPGNVMLHDGATRSRIMDFGLARAAFDNADLTSNDHAVGTPAYMAPEQIRGHNTDARADLFSLGSVIYFMLTGYAPFNGRTQAETVHKILDTTPPKLHDLDPSIPPVLSDIVEGLLKKNPDERYQSALEVADVLNRLLAQLNQTATGELSNVLKQKRPVAPELDETVLQRTGGEQSHRMPFLRTRPFVTGALLGMFALAVVYAAWRSWPADRTSTGGASGTGASTDGNGASPPIEPAAELLTEITVGPDSRFQSIGEALKVVAPNGTITVVGPGPYTEPLTIRGAALNGLTLRAKPRARLRISGTADMLSIDNASGIVVEGFDFDCEGGVRHGMDVAGVVEDLTIRDCAFLHATDEATRSLLAIRCQSKQADSAIRILQCRFDSHGGLICVSADSGEASCENLIVEGCQFSAPYTQFFATHSCRRLKLAGNVFLGGTNAINLDIQSWSPESRIEIVNNTFAGTKYWLGFVGSFRGDSVPPGPTDSRVCNNLILGGEVVQAGVDQLQLVSHAWKFAANWWERDDTTVITEEMGGRLATLQSQLQIPVRNDPSHANYLAPQAGSPLLTSGCGGDLPVYIGAKGPPGAP